MDDDLTNLNKSGFPIVLVHRTSPSSLSIPSVNVENVQVTERLVNHLVEAHGKRRILFLRGPIDQEDSTRREIGYRSALQANDIPFDENLILNGVFERDVAYTVMNEFLGSEKRVAFDAVFTGAKSGLLFQGHFGNDGLDVLHKFSIYWFLISPRLFASGFLP